MRFRRPTLSTFWIVPSTDGPRQPKRDERCSSATFPESLLSAVMTGDGVVKVMPLSTVDLTPGALQDDFAGGTEPG